QVKLSLFAPRILNPSSVAVRQHERVVSRFHLWPELDGALKKLNRIVVALGVETYFAERNESFREVRIECGGFLKVRGRATAVLLCKHDLGDLVLSRGIRGVQGQLCFELLACLGERGRRMRLQK